MTKTVEIKLAEPFTDSPWLRWGRFISVPIILIGTGSALGSPAMEWLGFLCVIVVALSVVLHKALPKSMTIAEARARLDEIERDQTLSNENPN